jgi:hypothetical protein
VVGDADGGGGQLMFLFLNRRFLRGGHHEGRRGFASMRSAYLVFLYAPIILLPLFAFNDATSSPFRCGLHDRMVRGC